jgi:hypothetical protein
MDKATPSQVENFEGTGLPLGNHMEICIVIATSTLRHGLERLN